jgi:hypothetical protein
VLVAGAIRPLVEHDHRFDGLGVRQVEHPGAAEPRHDASAREERGLLGHTVLLGTHDREAMGGEELLDLRGWSTGDRRPGG